MLRARGSYRLRLAPVGNHIQWVAQDHGVERVCEDEPELTLGTRFKLLVSPLIPEALL